MNLKIYMPSCAALALVAALTLATPAFAQGSGPMNHGQMNWGGYSATNTQMQRPNMPMPNKGNGKTGQGFLGGNMLAGKMMAPVVSGIVSAVNGDIITLTSTMRMAFPMMNWKMGTTTPPTATTTVVYTVDATNATIYKSNATTTVASIAVGDTLFVEGTPVASTTDNIIAKVIFDGVTPGVAQKGNKHPTTATSTSPSGFVGNGEPVIEGTISAISTSTLTVTSESVVYSVDVSNAQILDGSNASSTIANLAVGDNVIVQGAVNGTSITASSVIDESNKQTSEKGHQSLIQSIGSFFGNLFRF